MIDKMKSFYRPRLTASLSIFLLFILSALCSENFETSYQMYNSKGEVLQFDYAMKAIELSPAIICYQDKHRSILLAMHERISPLLANKRQMQRMAKITPKIIALPIGYLPDCRVLMGQLCQLVAQHQLQYGDSSPSLKYLVSKTADWTVRGLYDNEKKDIQRPYAAAVILTNLKSPFDPETGFTFIGNTGSISKRRNLFLGKLSEENRKNIEKLIDHDDPSIDQNQRLNQILKYASSEYGYFESCIIDWEKNSVETLEVAPFQFQNDGGSTTPT